MTPRIARGLALSLVGTVLLLLGVVALGAVFLVASFATLGSGWVRY